MTTSSPSVSFFVTGGTLRKDASCYVTRKADTDLFEALQRGEFCYVLTSRQMGKSSLMVRTAERLKAQGVAVAVLDLTAVGLNLTPDQWYDGLLSLVGQQLDLEDELEDYWRENAAKAPMIRFFNALRQIVLERLRDANGQQKRVVLFVDEVDAVRSLSFSADEFFAGIRELYNRRTEDPVLDSLTFGLFGVAAPTDLIRDVRVTPFNIGQRIALADFAPAEANVLLEGLGGAKAAKILARVLYWTNGHPYLTQRICRTLVETKRQDVDRVCDELFFTSKARETEDNLKFVSDRLLRTELDQDTLLNLYAKIQNGRNIADDDTDSFLAALKLSGVVHVVGGTLHVRNRIYGHVFDKVWVDRNTSGAEKRRQREAYRKGGRLSLLFLGPVLIYVIMGIPMPRTPVATVDIADIIPAGIPVKVTDLSGAEIKDAKLENGKLTVTLPSRWGGNRWPFGWSWLNRNPGGFKVKLAPGEKEAGRVAMYGDLTFRNANGSNEFRLATSGNWNDKFTAKLPRTESFFVLLKVKKQGALKPDEMIKVSFIADDEQKDMTYTFRKEGVYLTNVPFDLSTNTDNEIKSVLVKAVTEDKGLRAEPVNIAVKRQAEASVVELVFNSQRSLTPEQIARAMKEADRKAAEAKGIDIVLEAFEYLIHSQDSRGENEAVSAKAKATEYLRSHPNDPKALAIAGYARTILGEKKEGLKQMQMAIDRNEYLGYVCMLYAADLDKEKKQKYAMRVNQLVNRQTNMVQKAFGHLALWEYYVSNNDAASADLELQNIVETDPKLKPQ